MKKIFSLVVGLTAMTTMSYAVVQQAQATVDCGTVKTITATPKAGYHFVEWNDHVTTASRSVTISENITYTATFAPNTNTAYTVKHYQQKLDGTYPADPTDTDNLTGTTATTTAAVAKSYTGFTKVDFSQGTIAGDGSTVVTIQYTRNSYTLAWVTDGDALSGAYTKGSTLYGAAITAPNTPTKTGYTFAGWTPATSATMPAANTTYTATWTANTNTHYTVKHWQQNLTGSEYTEVTGDRQDLTGTTGAQTVATAKTTGVYAYFNAKSFSQAEIAADGSTIINIYYDRKTYTATFKNGEATLETVENVRYGVTPEYTGATPTKAEDETNRYAFNGWSPALGAISANTVYTAQFTAIPKTYYTITTAVSPTGKGTATGNGSYESGTKVTLTATAGDDCYVFEKWAEDNNTNATREITVSGDATYTAVFTALQYTLTVKSEDDSMGTVVVK